MSAETIAFALLLWAVVFIAFGLLSAAVALCAIAAWLLLVKIVWQLGRAMWRDIED